MKTFIVIFLVLLFVLTLYCYFQDKNEKCIEAKKKDERIKKINRAKKNLHPVINRNVDRDNRGRFCKKK